MVNEDNSQLVRGQRLKVAVDEGLWSAQSPVGEEEGLWSAQSPVGEEERLWSVQSQTGYLCSASLQDWGIRVEVRQKDYKSQRPGRTREKQCFLRPLVTWANLQLMNSFQS